MSVLQVSETPTATAASSVRINLSGGSAEREVSRKFVVQCDSIYSTVEDIVSASGGELPALYSSHPSLASATLIGYSSDPIDQYNWNITATYSISSSSLDTSSNESVYPWKRPPFGIKCWGIPYQVALTSAYKDGDAQNNPTLPILNSALDPFNPPIMGVERHPVFAFSYYLKSFDLDWVESYEGTVNLGAVTILGVKIAKKCGMLNKLSASMLSSAGSSGKITNYWQVDVEIETWKKGFDVRVQDAGFHVLTPKGKAEIAVLDKDGTIGAKTKTDGTQTAVTEPQLLNGAGGLLTVKTGSTLQNTTPHILSFPVLFPKNWGALNFPKTVRG